jgi:hypothetical protein
MTLFYNYTFKISIKAEQSPALFIGKRYLLFFNSSKFIFKLFNSIAFKLSKYYLNVTYNSFDNETVCL